MYETGKENNVRDWKKSFVIVVTVVTTNLRRSERTEIIFVVKEQKNT